MEVASQPIFKEEKSYRITLAERNKKNVTQANPQFNGIKFRIIVNIFDDEFDKIMPPDSIEYGI